MRRETWAAVCVLGFGCGSGAADAPPPDAASRLDARVPDAGAAPACIERTDVECGYTPDSIAPDEISLAEQAALARRFNPALVVTHEHLWPVSFDYLLEVNVAGLEQAEHDGQDHATYDVDERTRAPVTPAPDLTGADWSALPVQAESGRGLVYFADVRGDNTGPGYDDETWSAEWIAAQGNDDSDPLRAAYPPVQYAHLFWLSRDDRLLAIQYWLYYPYDKYVNNHEGDWEHVNVIVRVPIRGAPVIEGAHFYLHEFEMGVARDDLARITDRDGGDGDHVVVFVGGDACLNLVPDVYCGRASGASYPWPGRYTFNSVETVAGGASRSGRSIHANDIEVVLLPRVEDVDYAAAPNLSWHALPFIAGQPTVAANAPAVVATNNHRAPTTPSNHPKWAIGLVDLYDAATYADPEPMVVPDGWTLAD